MAHEEEAEHEFLGKHKDKVWTYLILLMVLIALAVIINFVVKNPESAEHGMKTFVGLPTWVIAVIVFVVGAVIFWAGLKVETDWPEALGAFMIAGAIAALEWFVGWSRFDLGGLFVVPYLIPIVVFLLLLMYAVRNSV